jgi:ketosteroid isomerase-like protein
MTTAATTITTTATATRESVGRLLQLIVAADADAVAAAYAEQVDWRLDWPADCHGTDVPWIRERRTRADVADHYRSIADHHEPELADLDLEHLLVDGEDAVLTGTLVNTLRHNQVGYRARFALHLTVHDGLVTRHHVYEDSLAVARAWSA